MSRPSLPTDRRDAASQGRPSWRPLAVAAALLLLFAAPRAWILGRYGVCLGGDSHAYLASAGRLLRGELVPDELRSRIGYIALIALCQGTGLGLGALVAAQVAGAALASLALYDLGRRLAGGWAGVLAAGLFAGNPDIARWDAFVLTDSPYISLVVLATWGIDTAYRRGRAWYGVAAALLAAAALTRPNGWLFLPIASCCWLPRLVRSPRLRLAAGAAVVGGFVAGAFVLLSLRPGLLTNLPDTMLRRGEVIWGYPEGRLPMPADPEGGSGCPGAVGYVVRHPGASARLAALRVLTELAHVRPFYSPGHNAAVALLLPPLYLLALVGFVRARREPLARLLAAVGICHLMVQAVNYADWDGRFLLYVLPLIGVLSAAGAHGLAAALGKGAGRLGFWRGRTGGWGPD